MLVTASYPPRVGGLEIVASTLATEFRRKGYQVSVVTQRFPRTLPGREKIDGVNVRRLYFISPRLRYVAKGRIDLWLAGLFYLPVTTYSLFRRIAMERPGVLNLHFLGGPALFVLIARRLLRFHFIVSLHGNDVLGLSTGTWLDRWVFKRALREADAVTACSRDLLTKAVTIEPSIGDKSSVIYNGTNIASDPVEVTPESESSRGLTIVAVGRLVPAKGFDILLEALQIAHNIGLDAQILLVGDGPERVALEEASERWQLVDRVQFLGSKPHEETLRLIRGASLVVVPSRDEPFGLVALEAMAAGKPVIASRTGGLPEVLEGADAILVMPNGPGELAAAIVDMAQKLVEDPLFGKRNRQLAERFSVERMVSQYLSLCECIYAGTGKDGR